MKTAELSKLITSWVKEQLGDAHDVAFGRFPSAKKPCVVRQVPVSPVVKRYLNGSAICRYTFDVMTLTKTLGIATKAFNGMEELNKIVAAINEHRYPESAELCKHGWARVANDGNPRLGDILLNDTHHVALYIGGGRIAQASRGEYGHRISGGKAGDQDGYETNTRNYYNYPWNCYLRYAAAPQASDIAVTNSQRIAVDGYWGSGTTLAWQKIFGTVQDGIVSSQWIGNKGILRGCTQGFEWVSNPKGSPLIRKIQAMVGVPQDGIIGPVTVRALEKKYGYLQDGVLDCPSLTIKAFQADANRRL